MNEYKKILDANGIQNEQSGDEIVMFCPFCEKTQLGNPIATFNIEPHYGRGHCSACNKDAEWEDTRAALKISPISEKKTNEPRVVQGSKALPRIWTVGEILGNDFGREDWLVEFLIPKQGMTALSGSPGDFKTWVTIHIARCVARGLPVFGKYKTAQGAVLVIDEEDHIREVQKRLTALGVETIDDIVYLSQGGIKIDNEESRRMILEIVRERNIKLVILDSLVRIHGQEENDSGGMAKVFKYLQEIIAADASVLFTHHHRKEKIGQQSGGQSMRGSSDILAAVDCHMTVQKKNEEENRLVLKQTKLRQAEQLKAFEVEIIKGEPDENGKSAPSGFEFVGDYDIKKKKAEEAAEILILSLEDGMKSTEEIYEILKGEDFHKPSIETALKAAKASGDIEVVPRDERPDKSKMFYYRIPENAQSGELETDD